MTASTGPADAEQNEGADQQDCEGEDDDDGEDDGFAGDVDGNGVHCHVKYLSRW